MEKNHDICKNEYVGMPEYNNNKIDVAKITATFKFRNEKDFKEFEEFIKYKLYEGEKVFDGMQKKDKKTAWFPPRPKSSKFYYE